MALQIEKKFLDLAQQAEADLGAQFAHVDAVAQANTGKVLEACQDH